MIPLWLAAALLHPDGTAITTDARRLGVPPQLAIALAFVESRTDTNPYLLGLAGEIGRFQILPATWDSARCPGRITDPRANRRCAFRRLRTCHARWGNWADATRCYNGRGPRTYAYLAHVRRALHEQLWAQLGRLDLGAARRWDLHPHPAMLLLP